MGFSTALSGLAAASKNLAVTGNNIANANTTGFKKSRTEFADVYAASLGGVSSITAGSGVRVSNVAQQFNQGNLNFTDNSLDLAISGEGFFSLAASPTDVNNRSYTRAGEFKLDKDGYIVNNQGQALLAYRPNGNTVADGFSTGVMQPIQINTIAGQPRATDELSIVVNLDASKAPAAVTPFDKTNVNTYTSQTSATVYDSFGTSHIFTTYFVNKGVVAGDPTWRVYHYIDGNAVTLQNGNAFGELKFDAVGNLKAPVNTTTGVVDGLFDLAPYAITPATGASDIDISKLSYFGSTQFNQKFSVNELNQNGLPAGQLTGIDIDDEGVIFARFSNGGSKTLGQVALSRFSNPQGLSKLGDTTWGQNAGSGDPVSGQPGSNNFGVIQSGSLEASNVELSKQLVNLIVAQQAYQANAKTITTENQIIQSILNI
ncbi:flagellar hook protein FlgE [methane-oxidizing endosymbiont of Gigantopelta aegis]|uniref:flagellar hook protein FlgE n=1 Tax=methane-oxidizing endosymbiont of Gigantopelta aegis TaxID=2794938 RepID=UPI0018DCBD99|nr:flagellar hook protein FlgE [methane-oxidizing endosymbiont of Gigantopelta aegis]